jgi:hypothetical protein
VRQRYDGHEQPNGEGGEGRHVVPDAADIPSQPPFGSGDAGRNREVNRLAVAVGQAPGRRARPRTAWPSRSDRRLGRDDQLLTLELGEGISARIPALEPGAAHLAQQRDGDAGAAAALAVAPGSP